MFFQDRLTRVQPDRNSILTVDAGCITDLIVVFDPIVVRHRSRIRPWTRLCNVVALLFSKKKANMVCNTHLEIILPGAHCVM